MSFRYPRRVRDLPAEPESEDDFTPQKPRKGGTNTTQANKENETASSSNSSANNAFTNMRMYPKRSSELPAFESDDSEEDDNVKNDNLNCAILNDSFILSPSKSEPDENESVSTSLKDDYHKISSAEKAKGSSSSSNGNLSFLLLFDKMGLNNVETNDAPKQTPKASKPPSTTTSCSTLPSIQEYPKTSGDSAVNAASIAQPQIQPKQSKLLMAFKDETAAINAAVSALATTAAADAKFAKFTAAASDAAAAAANAASDAAAANAAATAITAAADAQFATPQIRSFSVQRRPRDLCSTQSQKTRSAIVNEFRHQKVLFQTPMAMSRAPLSVRFPPNDSITLSVCDTINESSMATPSTAEKSDGSEEKKAEGGDDVVAKTKKSLEGAFLETEKNDAEKEVDAVVKDSVKTTTSATRVKPLTTAPNNSKPTILRISHADYAIIRKLGCGGSSSVYLARREDNAKEYALKVVDLRGDPTVVEGYLNETKLLAKLQGNVCVVALYQYELLRKESKLYLVMEKGDSDLHKILQTYSTNLPLYVLTNFLYQMLQAVNYIHQNGVIHSDLKPANFLMINGRLKLIDFGIASNIAIDSTSIIKFSQAGTFNYISPEALTDTSTGSSPMRSHQPKIKISTKSDVWSLGCILYLFLYKKTPFSHIKNIYAKVSAISCPTHAIEYPTLPLYYPAVLVDMTKNCLQHNPKMRPSCADLLQYPFNMLIPIQNLTVPSQ